MCTIFAHLIFDVQSDIQNWEPMQHALSPTALIKFQWCTYLLLSLKLLII